VGRGRVHGDRNTTIDGYAGAMHWAWRIRAVCANCGYPISELRRGTVGVACPECGAPVRPVNAARLRAIIRAPFINRLTVLGSIGLNTIAAHGFTTASFTEGRTAWYGIAWTCAGITMGWSLSAPFLAFIAARAKAGKGVKRIAVAAALTAVEYSVAAFAASWLFAITIAGLLLVLSLRWRVGGTRRPD